MDDKPLVNLIRANRNSFYKFFLKNENPTGPVQYILNRMYNESKNIEADLLVRWICRSGIFPHNIIKNDDGFMNTESIHKFIIKLTYLFVYFKSRIPFSPSPSPSPSKLLFLENSHNWGFVDVKNYITFHRVELSGTFSQVPHTPLLPQNSALQQPTWTASVFLTCPEVNSYQDIFNVSFTKYLFPIIVNSIAFYEVFPKGSIHLMYDPEGAFQSTISNLNKSCTSPNAVQLSGLEKALQILSLHQSQFNDYEEVLAHKVRTKLQKIIGITSQDLPQENISFEHLFIYLLNACAPSLNQLRIFRYTVSQYFKTKDGQRLGTNSKKVEMPRGLDIPGHGFLGQSMRFFFLRQRAVEKEFAPPSFCLFLDAHTFGFCEATRQVFEAFRENYLRRKSQLQSDRTQYLFGHNYNYSRSWHTPLPPEFQKKYQHSKKSPICGFIGVIGDTTESPLMCDGDYQETFAKLLTFREAPLNRINFSCDLDYGNDEFLIGKLFQKYADPRQQKALYFPLHYFYGPHNIFNIYQEKNEQIVMKRIYRICYSKMSKYIVPHNKLLQIRDLKHYLMNNTQFPDKTPIPFYFKYCVPSHLNFVCAYACSENIVLPYLETGGTLGDLEDDKQVGRITWKIPDRHIGFKVLQGLKLNIHELFFDSILTTWLTDHILPDKTPTHILIKTFEDYKRFYTDIFKPISTNPLLPKFLDISGLRNFRISVEFAPGSQTRRQLKINSSLQQTRKNLMVKVVH